MTVHVFEQGRKCLCLIQVIIDAAYQTVLKGQTAAGLLKIRLAGRQDFL